MGRKRKSAEFDPEHAPHLSIREIGENIRRGLDPLDATFSASNVHADKIADRIPCPFTVVVDTREQRPYTFSKLRANADQGRALFSVPVIRRALGTGDYAIDGLPRFAIERKTKEDLWGSILRRDNFIARLARFTAEHDQGFIVVESEISDILRHPPIRSSYPVKAVLRTIQAWKIRFPSVHWEFLPGRDAAEAWTFRLLQAYHREKTGGK